ncbi:hypothetical protein, partial [Sphingorhabdus sp.]|uniref:hypothetical protein n=1 Tax=Sphingorhabdus sp. TaxID=1902408 RepID=UPI0039839D14
YGCIFASMPSGYRGLTFAALIAALLIAFGLGSYLTGLPNPQERYQPYQNSYADKNRALSTVSNIAPAVVEKTPCDNPKSETESDLCAQWRAAKAAEKSANWTLYGVVASAIGISLLLWQIMLTREAVKDTGDATKAMQEANSIARSAASKARQAEFAGKIKSRIEDQARTASEQRQMRAYVSVEPGGVNQSYEGFSRLPYNIKNSGRTPAYDLALCGDIIIVQGDPRNFNPSEQGRIGEGDAVASTDITLGPNDNQWSYAYMDDGLIQGHRQKIAQRKAAVVHYGFLQYRDAFDNIRRTNFAFYHWGDELSDKESKRCRFGNNAT